MGVTLPDMGRELNASGVEMGLSLSGIPHQKGGVAAALDFLADPTHARFE